MEHQGKSFLNRYADWVGEPLPELAWDDVKKDVTPEQAFGAACAGFIWWLLRRGKERGSSDE